MLSETEGYNADMRTVETQVREDDIFDSVEDHQNCVHVDLLAEVNHANRKAMSDIFDNISWEREKSCNYKIQIITNEKFQQTADDLRIMLNDNGNAAFIQSYIQYAHENILSDYYILLGSSTKDKRANALLDAYGCHIKVVNNHIYAYVTDMGDYSNGLEDTQWKEFITYYESVIGNAVSENDNIKEANKTRIKKQDRAQNSVVDSILNASTSVSDYLQEKLGLFGVILSLPLIPATIVSALSLGITEAVAKTTVNALSNKDVKALSEAQKQILEVRLSSLISAIQFESANPAPNGVR